MYGDHKIIILLNNITKVSLICFRARLTYENDIGKNQVIELLKELCEMSFKTETKHYRPIETESCCACDEAVYEVNSFKSQLMFNRYL